jgi:hypothetical protein
MRIINCQKYYMKINKKIASILSLSVLFFCFFCGRNVMAGSGESNEFIAGYLARLLINEVPFPGENSYKSVEDSKSAMTQILWVIHCRRYHIPPGYRQVYIANVKSENIIDIITADGQCDGFYRNEQGIAVTEPRVEKRFKYLFSIANKGGKPGKFAELLNFGQGLAKAYVEGGIEQADRFAGLNTIKGIMVTGRAYAWMTDKDFYRPGGNFVFIPDGLNGSIGGNRFYTLKKKVNAK